MYISFYFFALFFLPCYFNARCTGIFYTGKVNCEVRSFLFYTSNNLQYIGPHWHSQDGQKYFTTFPPGFPFLIAIIYKLFGANPTFLINLILASIGLSIFFFLSKNWLSNNWALAATFFLAINPFYNEHALFGDSHTSLIFFFLLGLLFIFYHL